MFSTCNERSSLNGRNTSAVNFTELFRKSNVRSFVNLMNESTFKCSNPQLEKFNALRFGAFINSPLTVVEPNSALFAKVKLTKLFSNENSSPRRDSLFDDKSI